MQRPKTHQTTHHKKTASNNLKPKELNFVHGVDQLINQDAFIDCGISHKIVINKHESDSKQRKQQTSRMVTNESATLYFKEVKQTT